ncbi:pentatricopeptide repeat-containing protein At3g62890-like [Amborella trichopoda]|uniref:pentatricopeptide repeat-containing protein At3g62890-like n=1 Tax=Amborella trichopoda TaxID=13333 RepID=UPI0005D335BD|nr:pentatricopeptide repeat-containing protein At3g62890-like [Amborella trichopoda]|eukprot:XP_011622603.1 pentatricopeptide repeat-containing protein At3g62890-like [Amborella trichopoda]
MLGHAFHRHHHHHHPLKLSIPPKISTQDASPWLPPAPLLSKYPTLQHLHSCTTMHHLRQLHAHTLVSGSIHDNFVASRLLSFTALSLSGDLPYARLLFRSLPYPDTFMANTLIRSYTSVYGAPLQALEFYVLVLSSGINPDIHTLPLVLRACSDAGALSLGSALHAYVIKRGWTNYSNVTNFVVKMYSECGSIELARRVFDEMLQLDDASWNVMLGGYANNGMLEEAQGFFEQMPEHDVISWSVMITGLCRQSKFREALMLFRDMLEMGISPNESVTVNVLSACAYLGALDQGKWLHAYDERKRASLTVKTGTALIDMYAKCGCIDEALKVFHGMKERNVLAWSAMIVGLAANGRPDDALGLFSLMEDSCVKPNDVTFIGVLSACSHAGLVSQGCDYFRSMREVHGIEPTVHHHCCMVDLYGRVGLLEEALELIQSMPIEPNSAIWGALLSACKLHGNLKLGEMVGKKLIDLEPNHGGRYVLLSNIYAAAERWEEVAEMRRLMRERGVRKTPGCSFIDVGGKVHEFVAGDNSHPQSKRIYLMLGEMGERLRLAGYEPNKGQVLLDMDEEEKEIALGHHSEKLAIAFGFINSEPGTPIRITKNLRVCEDCHFATKLLSKTYGREIIVRDRSRFHHFKDGSCSCKDFW